MLTDDELTLPPAHLEGSDGLALGFVPVRFFAFATNWLSLAYHTRHWQLAELKHHLLQQPALHRVIRIKVQPPAFLAELRPLYDQVPYRYQVP